MLYVFSWFSAADYIANALITLTIHSQQLIRNNNIQTVELKQWESENEEEKKNTTFH